MEQQIQSIVVSEDRGGHDGAANGGHFGPYTVVFGLWPDGAVVVGDEKPGAVHTYRPGRLAEHRDKWEKEWSFDASVLRDGDFVATEAKYDGLVYNSHGGDINILAHRLPIAEVPEVWEPVGGTKSSSSNGYGEKSSWSFVRTTDGTAATFEQVVEQLGLTEMIHPFGKIWLDGDTPVAVTDRPTWSGGRDDHSFSNHVVCGDRTFFAQHGLAVLEYEDKDTYYGAGDYYTCSQEIVQRGLDLANLREKGWYPVAIKEHFVLWGTGLHLYAKHCAWQVGLDPAHGMTEDKRGARLYDSSPNRLERVKQFFSEVVGLAASDPQAEYIRLANATDPRGGQWRNRYQYPDEPWIPAFSGWDLSRFGEIECRWKQPKVGTAHFYGLLRKEQPIERRSAFVPPTAMAAAFAAAEQKAS